jgi:hypothetical protein
MNGLVRFLFSVPGVIAILGIAALAVSGRRRARAAVAPSGRTPAVMQIVVSVLVLAAGLWVMLSGRYDADVEKWAAGAIGTVVGFWLKA